MKDYDFDYYVTKPWLQEEVGLPEDLSSTLATLLREAHEFLCSTNDEGLVEAFCHQTARIIGLMWHPERYARPQSFDTSLIKQFFLNRNEI